MPVGVARAGKGNYSLVPKHVEDTFDSFDIQLIHDREICRDISCPLTGCHSLLDYLQFLFLEVNWNVRAFEVVYGSGVIQMSVAQEYRLEILGLESQFLDLNLKFLIVLHLRVIRLCDSLAPISDWIF